MSFNASPALDPLRTGMSCTANVLGVSVPARLRHTLRTQFRVRSHISPHMDRRELFTDIHAYSRVIHGLFTDWQLFTSQHIFSHFHFFCHSACTVLLSVHELLPHLLRMCLACPISVCVLLFSPAHFAPLVPLLLANHAPASPTRSCMATAGRSPRTPGLSTCRPGLARSACALLPLATAAHPAGPAASSMPGGTLPPHA